MKHLIAATLSCLFLSGCGGDQSSHPSTVPAAEEPGTNTAPAAGAPDSAATAPADGADSAVGDEISLEEARKVVARVAELMTELADKAAGAGSDCAAVAVAMNSWYDSHGPEFKDIETRGSKIPERYGAELKEAGQKLQEASGKLIGAIGPCQSDPAVQQAVERLSSKPE